MMIRAIIVACVLTCTGVAQAQIANDTIRIGLITDMSGVYVDNDGPGGAEAVRMAIADMGGAIDGKKVELLVADHQNKPDLAASKAREWFDRDGVDMLIGGVNSAASLAMAKVAAQKEKVYFAVGAGSSRLTNEECTPFTIHYAYDTTAMARSTGATLVKEGGKSWFFITADYSFGASLESDTAAVVKANGGTVKGDVKHPLNTSDFSSYLLQAQASKAQVLGLANAGGDTVNAIKTAREFGVTPGMQPAGLLIFVNEVHAMGLDLAQGLYLTDGWYWDTNEQTRAWSKRFFEKIGRMPSILQAADYSATTQYLSAVKKLGTRDSKDVMRYLKDHVIDDLFTKHGVIRPDGRMVYDMSLFQVKKPSESKYPWDYYRLVRTVPGSEAYGTKDESKCPLWK